MIIGIHTRDNDLVVNRSRASSSPTSRARHRRSRAPDHADQLTESAIEFIADDEMVEITPKNIRLRKRFLKGTSASARPRRA